MNIMSLRRSLQKLAAGLILYILNIMERRKKMKTVRTTELFDLTHTLCAPLLERHEYPWTALSELKEFIVSLGGTLPTDKYYSPAPDIWISKDAVIAPSAVICGPAIIGSKTELRTGAFIRGGVVVGENCVVGNSCELKNAVLFDNVQVPHFNYIGDSILGYRAHTGAGAITSNVKSDKTHVSVETDGGRIDTALKKLGAMIGDFAEIGCNSVLNPGSIIGRNSNVYPLSSVRGTVPPDSIFKSPGNIVKKREK